MADAINDTSDNETMILVADIIAAYVNNNKVSTDDLQEIIQQTYFTLQGLGAKDKTAQSLNQKPAVPIKDSVKKDHIVCLEDGKKLKMLKRYLRSRYDMSPDDYRRKWGLPADYPMVAPDYSKRRSAFAKEIGLGKGAAAGGRKKKATTKKKATRKKA